MKYPDIYGVGNRRDNDKYDGRIPMLVTVKVKPFVVWVDDPSDVWEDAYGILKEIWTDQTKVKKISPKQAEAIGYKY